MGRIADQKMEHLVPSDKAIIQYRKRLRKLCRDLEQGIEPSHVTGSWPNPIPTYGGDTVLRVPRQAGGDNALLTEIGERVMQIQFEAESMSGAARDEAVIAALKSLEAKYQS
jgi:hypothetical protein